MSVVTLEGEIIHYEVLGRGRPLIFLHGWVGSWRYWVPTMQAASMGYRAYAIDLWGFGDSAKRPQKYGLENQVNLLDQFMDAMGIAKIALIGHGLGAVVAQSFCARFPQYVDRVMVTSLPLGPGSVNGRMRSTSPGDLADWLLSRQPGMEAARAEAPKADPQALATTLDGLQTLNTYEVANRVQTPCLLVYGATDPAVLHPSNELINTMPEQTHVVTFDQSGHFPMLEEPSRYNRLLGDFLALSSGESPRQLQLKEEWKRRVR